MWFAQGQNTRAGSLYTQGRTASLCWSLGLLQQGVQWSSQTKSGRTPMKNSPGMSGLPEMPPATPFHVLQRFTKLLTLPLKTSSCSAGILVRTVAPHTKQPGFPGLLGGGGMSVILWSLKPGVFLDLEQKVILETKAGEPCPYLSKELGLILSFSRSPWGEDCENVWWQTKNHLKTPSDTPTDTRSLGVKATLVFMVGLSPPS